MEIEKDVPLPASVEKNSYPYRNMEIGDSFYVEGIKLNTMLNTNWRWSRKLDRNFIARKEGDGIRVWRVD